MKKGDRDCGRPFCFILSPREGATPFSASGSRILTHYDRLSRLSHAKRMNFHESLSPLSHRRDFPMTEMVANYSAATRSGVNILRREVNRFPGLAEAYTAAAHCVFPEFASAACIAVLRAACCANLRAESRSADAAPGGVFFPRSHWVFWKNPARQNRVLHCYSMENAATRRY